MRVLSLLAGLGAVSTAAAVGLEGRFNCKAEATPEFLRAAAEMAELEANGGATSLAAAATTVNVYFHVVARSNSVSGGYISNATLIRQLDVMNQDFAPAGISFRHVATDYTINTNWASDGNEIAMKRALRKGTYRDLNLYFLYSIDGFGYCYLPTTVSSGSTAFIQDGCTILASTVPGGSSTNYNLGKTVTHEVGHWFGLLHTFEGNSCSGSGDQVSDTPQQASATSGCPTGRDSCPNQAGLDPITNYMDYSTE